MARIRTIKPEFWTDERVGEVSVRARLLLIGALNFADDHGGLERSAKQLKAQVFPYDDIDCEPLVLELIRVGLFVEYEVGNRKYLHIKGFSKHQKVENRSAPRVPLYDDSLSLPPAIGESSPSPHRVLGEPSDCKGREGKGRERKGDTQPESHSTQLSSLKLDHVGVVFAHWQKVHCHPHAVCDAKRRKLVLRALQLYPVETLCQAISGYANSPHHMGQNDRNTRYDSLEVMLRDPKHIEAGVKLHVEPPSLTAPKTKYEQISEALNRE